MSSSKKVEGDDTVSLLLPAGVFVGVCAYSAWVLYGETTRLMVIPVLGALGVLVWTFHRKEVFFRRMASSCFGAATISGAMPSLLVELDIEKAKVSYASAPSLVLALLFGVSTVVFGVLEYFSRRRALGASSTVSARGDIGLKNVNITANTVVIGHQTTAEAGTEAAEFDKVHKQLAEIREGFSTLARVPLRRPQVPHQDADAPTYASVYDPGFTSPELETISKLVKGGLPDEALDVLAEFEKRSWTQLEDGMKYRHRRLCAAARIQRGESQKAGELLVAARDFAPEDEQARACAAIGYQLLGEREKAFQLASEVCTEYPGLALAATVRIRNAPADVTPKELADSLDASVASAPDVLVALSERYRIAGQTGQAVELLVRGSAEENHHEYYLAKADAILQHEADNANDGRTISEPNLVLCEEALSNVLKHLPKKAFLGRRALTHLALMTMHELRGDLSAAKAELFRASEVTPNEPRVLFCEAQWQMREGSYSDAIESLDRLVSLNSGKGLGDINLLLAEALLRTAQPEQVARGLRLLRTTTAFPGEGRHAARRLVRHFLTEGMTADAESAIEEYEDVLGKFLAADLRVRVAEESGDKAVAAELATALQSSAGLTDAQKKLTVDTLLRLGLRELAFDMLKDLAPRDRLADETMLVLRVAADLGHSEFLCGLCKELRSHGVDDQGVVDAEIVTMQNRGEISAAIQLAEAHLQLHPDDAFIRLRASLLQISIGDLENIEKDVSRLPHWKQSPPETARAVVQVLRAGGRSEEAIRYAYAAFRHYRNEPEAWMAMLLAVGPLEGPERDRSEDPTTVEIGAAVEYREDGEQSQWLIVEDSDDADESRSEFSPNHKFVESMWGLKAGDQFAVERAGFPNREFVIETVTSKYVFRYQQCLKDWERRFPGMSGPMMFRVPKKTGDLLDTLLPSLKARANEIERLEKVYEENPACTLHMLAQGFSTTIFGVVVDRASRSGLAIRCSAASDQSVGELEQRCLKADRIILDTSALGTLTLLELSERVADLGWSVCVSQGTIDELRTYIREIQKQTGAECHLGASGDEVTFSKNSLEASTAYAASLTSTLAAVEAACEVFVESDRTQFSDGDWDTWTRMGGIGTAEAVHRALRTGDLLWTDDASVAGFSGQRGVAAVWTQLALSAATRRNNLTEAEFSGASAKLVGWGYNPTRVGPGIYIAAAELADWEIQNWPFPQNLDTLLDRDCPSEVAAKLGLAAIHRLWSAGPSEELSKSAVHGVLDRLASRPDARAIILSIAKATEEIVRQELSDNAEVILATILDWLKNRRL